MAATLLHMGYQLLELPNRTLKILDDYYHGLPLQGICTTASHIYFASISLSKTYKGQGRLAPKYMLDL